MDGSLLSRGARQAARDTSSTAIAPPRHLTGSSTDSEQSGSATLLTWFRAFLPPPLISINAAQDFAATMPIMSLRAGGW